MQSIYQFIKKIFNLFGMELSRKSVINKKANLWLAELHLKTIIDIGANEGQFASFIKGILPTCKIICFEPLREPFLKLQERYGKDNTMTLHDFALGKKQEVKIIFKNSYNPSSSILPMANRHAQSFPHTKDVTQENIRIETLDDIFPSLNIEKPFLIKIDVQGYEKFVIEGGIETIKKADIMIVELSYVELYKDQPLFDEIYSLLTKNGFMLSGILDQLTDPKNGEFLQCDAIFINKNIQKNGK